MKQITILIILIVTGIILYSCQKEISCEGCRNNNKPPIAVAGPDEVITLPTDSVSLDGSASNDPDGRISKWQWRKISGPASFSITTSTTAKTTAKTLVAGSYQFELMVTDNGGLFAKDTVQITINAITPTNNHPPVANAGSDQTITLPTNSVIIDGSGSTDLDNNITTYEWKKISGPSAFTLSNPSAAQTQATGLARGVYEFELKVTDAVGLNDKDTLQVMVNPETNNQSVDIYVAGMNNGLPVYWKNGAMVAVDNAASGFGCTSIAVVGGDVYVAGWSNGLFYYEWAAQYWKNGQGTPLGNYAGATSIAVAGTDVYVAGWELENGSFVAKYWKNGQGILLGGISEASANSIVAVGNDIYVAGYEGGVAKYWKNGQAVSLTNGTNQAFGNSIAVVGNDIYVAGSEVNGSHQVAKYWKNGQAIPLTNGSIHATATSIAVAGGDVYVAGWEGDTYGLVGGTVSVAKYWKNGQDISLTNGTNYAYATSIATYGSDVYVAGYEIVGGQYQPKYWKNGQAISLPSNGGWAMSIVVKN